VPAVAVRRPAVVSVKTSKRRKQTKPYVPTIALSWQGIIRVLSPRQIIKLEEKNSSSWQHCFSRLTINKKWEFGTPGTRKKDTFVFETLIVTGGSQTQFCSWRSVLHTK